MRLMNLVPPEAVMTHGQANNVGECDHCHKAFTFKDGVVARIEHETRDYEKDDEGRPYPIRRVRLLAYHNQYCMTAILRPEGSC